MCAPLGYHNTAEHGEVNLLICTSNRSFCRGFFNAIFSRFHQQAPEKKHTIREPLAVRRAPDGPRAARVRESRVRHREGPTITSRGDL